MPSLAIFWNGLALRYSFARGSSKVPEHLRGVFNPLILGVFAVRAPHHRHAIIAPENLDAWVFPDGSQNAQSARGGIVTRVRRGSELGGLTVSVGGLLLCVREARPEHVAEDLFSFLVIPRKFFRDSFLF